MTCCFFKIKNDFRVSGSSSTIPVSLLLNGGNHNGSSSGSIVCDTTTDRGWYDVDSDQIYYYASPAQHGKGQFKIT